MTRLVRSLATVLGLGLLLALGASPVQAQEPVRIVFETADDGYVCIEGCDAVDDSSGPWGPVIDVPLGTLVELHFVWAHDEERFPFEEHIMRLDGYGLSTRAIDRDNREATLRFIADQPGSFTLKCDLDCDLHDYMQRAQVRVIRSGGTAAATYTSTVLLMRPPVSEVRGFDVVPLEATLTDDDGGPVELAEVHFYLEAEFAGARDLVLIGTARTDEQGTARYDFRPFTADPEQRLVVRFPGMGVYDESESEIRLPLTSAPNPVYTPERTGFEQLRGLARVSVVITIAAVWAALGFVLLYAVRIRRAGGEQ